MNSPFWKALRAAFSFQETRAKPTQQQPLSKRPVLDRDEAVRRINLLAGADLRALADELGVTVWKAGRKNKGWAGHVLERYLGLAQNSRQAPDFGEWDLKLVSLRRDSAGRLRVKETMAITMLEPSEVVSNRFEDSHLYDKLRRLVVVSRIHESAEDARSVLHAAAKFDLDDPEIFRAVKEDYELIRATIRDKGFAALTGTSARGFRRARRGAGTAASRAPSTRAPRSSRACLTCTSWPRCRASFRHATKMRRSWQIERGELKSFLPRARSHASKRRKGFRVKPHPDFSRSTFAPQHLPTPHSWSQPMPLARKKLFLLFAVCLATLASVAAIVPFKPRSGASLDSPAISPRQQQQQPSPSSLSATTDVEARPAAAEAVSTAETSGAVPAFAADAAQQNRALRDGLRWTFGGKQQHGWAIYVPLIQRLIGTEDDAASGNFAARLARWQKSAGLNASGVLDEATLMRIISTWQSRRRRGSTYPQAHELVTVPPAEFWDPSRADDLRKVERQTYAAYKRMLAAAVGDSSLQLASKNGELAASEKYLKIISAFRSREYQDRLRKLEPGAGRAALAVNSPHFTGRALDLYVGGEPTITKDNNRLLQTQTRAYRWLVRNAERFGFCPYFYEPWHWEYCAQ